LLGWSLYSLGLTINPLLSISCWMAAVMFGSIVALVIFSREGVELDNTGTGLILPGTLNTLVLYLMFLPSVTTLATQPRLTRTMRRRFRWCCSRPARRALPVVCFADVQSGSIRFSCP